MHYSKKMSVADLTERDLAQMFSLFARYYHDVDFERFRADLREKSHVLLFFVEDEKPQIVGFTTILLSFVLMPDGRDALTVFTGDTVVDQEYWGTKLLQKAFSRFLAQTKMRHPTTPVYWMLISKGHKTYLLMRRNLPNSFPCYKSEAPSYVQFVKDSFYKKKFGSFYDSNESLIDFGRSLGRVKESIAAPSEQSLKSADVQFFIKANPRFDQGVELACIGEIRIRDILFSLCKYAMPQALRAKLLPVPSAREVS
jgi:hypothetical protein